MKKYSSFLKILFLAFIATVFTGCVQDEKYADPDLTGYQCLDITPDANNTLITYKNVRDFYRNNTTVPGDKTYVIPETSTDYIEGYVSSTDETGNIYKTIYIQDKPENPTAGFVLSVDDVSTYTKFPQGAKVYIKLKGLAVGTYGELIQLGVKDAKTTKNGVSRIPEKIIGQHIFKSCTIKEKIVPKVMTLAEMVSANDELLGALIQVNDAEFDKKNLCTTYAPEGTSVDKQINDPTASLTTRVVRNSGFASFANQQLPAGKGTFIGIYSKFNSSYQMYINKVSDLSDMIHFPRRDGLTSNPCIFDPSSVTSKTVAEIKQLATSPLTQITGNFSLTAKVTANDETGNLFKYFYVEDATGGIRINVDQADLFLDNRFKVGKEVIIKLKDLYVGSVNGEIQIGQPFNGTVGRIIGTDVYKFFFDSNRPRTAVVPTEKTIAQLTTADVGRYVKINNVQSTNADLYNTFSEGAILEDCSNNKIFLRTNSRADFAGNDIDLGRGSIMAIVNYVAGKYELTVPFQRDANLENPRCDGSVPPPATVIFSDPFTNLNNFTTVSVQGTQAWNTTTFGNPAPSAIMDGNRQLNEDWLISPKISINGYKSAFLGFQTDGRFNGNPLEVYVTDNYTGNPSTTTWVKLDAKLDEDLNAFAGFVGSGKVLLDNYLNKEITIAIKYTSIAGFSTTWEVDNFKVRGIK